MSTVQLPKLADRCPAWAHDLVGLLRRLWRYRGSASLLYEAAKAQSGLSAVLNAYPHGVLTTSTASRQPWLTHERCAHGYKKTSVSLWGAASLSALLCCARRHSYARAPVRSCNSSTTASLDDEGIAREAGPP